MAQGIILLALAVVAVYAVLRMRQSKQAPAQVRRTGQAAGNPYHCVEVRSNNPMCNTAWRVAGVRFLSSEAPPLPMPGCEAASCTCQYIHHDDRRQEDRRNPYGQWGSVPPAITGERRSRTDRRRSSTFKPVITS